MPTDTWGNILFQAQMVLRRVAADGAADRTPEELLALADNVDRIHGDEYFRTTALHEPPRVVRWDDPDLEGDDEEEAA